MKTRILCPLFLDRKDFAHDYTPGTVGTWYTFKGGGGTILGNEKLDGAAFVYANSHIHSVIYISSLVH